MPAVTIFVVSILLGIIKDPSVAIGMDFWKSKIHSLIYASGVTLTASGTQVPALGIPWFLFALFFGRTIFDYLHLKFSGTSLKLIVVLLSLAGLLFGKTQWLPFSGDIVMAIMPLLYVGSKFEKFQIECKSWKKLIVFGSIWAFTLLGTFFLEHTYMELACRRYPMYPLCFITAIAGTLMVCQFSVLLQKLGKLTFPILYIGRNSLYFLCVHCIDGFWVNYWRISENQFANAIFRIFLDVIVFILFMLLKGFLKKIRVRKQV